MFKVGTWVTDGLITGVLAVISSNTDHHFTTILYIDESDRVYDYWTTSIDDFKDAPEQKEITQEMLEGWAASLVAQADRKMWDQLPNPNYNSLLLALESPIFPPEMILTHKLCRI